MCVKKRKITLEGDEVNIREWVSNIRVLATSRFQSHISNSLRHSGLLLRPRQNNCSTCRGNRGKQVIKEARSRGRRAGREAGGSEEKDYRLVSAAGISEDSSIVVLEGGLALVHRDPVNRLLHLRHAGHTRRRYPRQTAECLLVVRPLLLQSFCLQFNDAEFPPPSVLMQAAVTPGADSPSERGPPRPLLLLEEKLAFSSPGWTSACPWACLWSTWLLTTMGLTMAVFAWRTCLSSTLLDGWPSASLKKRS
ncbi:hypothetical protein EYF80_008226 [Liparis tanakae]|uniref:Uncharacterized protein n=1 Tax=Liparis tanakae TaxID=230148 RepID=A0A4Z2IVA4_9TELE|nr:hypothetical protein EYF80_008226 [Liparis tanakae]